MCIFSPEVKPSFSPGIFRTSLPEQKSVLCPLCDEQKSDAQDYVPVSQNAVISDSAGPGMEPCPVSHVPCLPEPVLAAPSPRHPALQGMGTELQNPLHFW